MKKAEFKDYTLTVQFLITFGSIEEVGKYLKKEGVDELVYSKDWGAFSGRTPSGKYHLHFEEYGFRPIVHETNHATLDILNDRGIKVNQETKELFAYYQAWLAGRCRDYLEKWTRPSKKRSKK